MGETVFEVGDRVRIKDSAVTRRGEVGTVVQSGPKGMIVKFDDGKQLAYANCEVDRVVWEAEAKDDGTPHWTIEGVLPLIKDAHDLLDAVNIVDRLVLKTDWGQVHPGDALSAALDGLYMEIGSKVVEAVER